MENWLKPAQIFLDTLLLFFCCQGSFRERPYKNPKDFLLFPLIAFYLLAARVGIFAGGQENGIFLTRGLEIAPADNLISSLFLMLVLLLTASLYYKPATEWDTFCGIMAAFSLYLLARTLSAFIFSLFMTAGTLFSFGCRILSLVPVIFFLCSPGPELLQQAIRNGGFIIRLVSANIAGVLLGTLTILSFDMERFTGSLWEITAVLSGILLLDSGLLYYNRRKAQEQKHIHMIEQYVPIVEELITQVRARQHEFNNRIFALRSAVFSADTLQEAKQSVAALTRENVIPANDRELLACDSKIIAGMLYGKIKQAEFCGIGVELALHGLFKKSSTPETDWIEVLGILMDNAVEASGKGALISVKSRQSGEFLELTVSNPAPPLSNTEFIRLFRKGVTSKKDHASHGFGLYNIRRITERCHGKIITRNEQDGGENHVVFGVLLP